MSLFRTGLIVLMVVTTAATLASAGDNAALVERGARIEMGNNLNTRWHKPGELIREGRNLTGPIINDLATGWLAVHFPVELTIERVGIAQSDYKGTFARWKEIEISAPGHETVTHTLENKPNEIQWVAFAAKADQITVRGKSLYPPDEGEYKHGGVHRFQVEVEEDLDALFAAPEDYVAGKPMVMPTPNRDERAAAVIGQPRLATEHPLTIWDSHDIAAIKKQIETHEAARQAFDGLIKFADDAVANPIEVPKKPDDGVDQKLHAQHNKVATGIGNLGIAYALTGNEDYARQARRMLLKLAEYYPDWPIHGHPNFTHDESKWSWQRLNDAIWLIPTAWGYDLIHNSPTLSDEDRSKIENDFLLPCGKFIINRSSSAIRAATNWSVILNASAMIAARVCGDEELLNTTRLGKRGDRSGGIYYHLDKGIDDDGMWAEGAIGYQFMAMRGLLVCAEILWRNGEDVYGYRNGRLKNVFDSPLWFAYPGGHATPALEDSGSASLFGRDAHLYQYALRRYGDKTYNAILSQVAPILETRYNLFLPAFDFAPVDATELPAVPSVLFEGTGYGIARSGAGDRERHLLLDHGPHRSHGHPDKLNFTLFALGQELFADAGSAWYSTDIYQKYYSTSLAHNTLSYNGQNQMPGKGRLEAYAQRGGVSILRASSDDAIPSTVFDRTLLMVDDRLYDLMHVRSGIPFLYDLPYHSHGKLTPAPGIDAQPWADHPKDAPGFAYYNNPSIARTDGDWQATWQVPEGQMRMHYLGEPGTQLIFATTPKGGSDLGTALVRRKTRRSDFVGVMDLVRNEQPASVREVSKLQVEGEQARAVRVELADGGHELLMVSYGQGEHRFGDWTTDARTAFVQIKGDRLNAAVLAGGTYLKGPAGSIQLDQPGQVIYRAVTADLAELANMTESQVKITLSGIAWADGSHHVDAQGQRTGAVSVNDGQATTALASMQRLELTRGQQPSVAQFETEQRRERLAAAEQRRQEELETLKAKAEAQHEAAADQDMPAGHFMLIQAEDFTGNGGGEVRVADNKTGDFGDSFLLWSGRGHWVEFEVDVEQPGWYQVALKYCREGGPAQRSLEIDGKFPVEPAEAIELDGTGGWSNGADNWRLHVMTWPRIETPALVHLTQGKHTLRMTNISGDNGVNLDYIVLAHPELTITRQIVERETAAP